MKDRENLNIKNGVKRGSREHRNNYSSETFIINAFVRCNYDFNTDYMDFWFIKRMVEQMKSPSERNIDHWNEERLEARIWWCGDHVCDCQQAEIRGVKPNHSAGFPWITPVVIWKGTFFSDGEGGDIPTKELLAEVKRLKKLGCEIEVSL